MKVKEIEISKSVCISLGNYETVRVHKTIRAELENKDTEFGVTTAISKAIDSYLLEEVDNIDQKGRQERSRAKRFGLTYDGGI